MPLFEAFRAHLPTLQVHPRRAIIAVSGGTDSLVLLDLVARTREDHGWALSVAHIDHGIHGDSGLVAERVITAAERYCLSIDVIALALGADASETVARERRYRELQRLCDRDDAILLTAHHADDQIETVLMRVLRGSGPAGLAGMAPVAGALVRPLLPFRRAELRAYAEERGIQAWEDPANRDPRHLRSWLRSEILPAIERRLTDAGPRLIDVAVQAADHRTAWDRLLDQLGELAVQAERDGISVAAHPFVGYDSTLARALIQALARRVGLVLGRAGAERAVALARGGVSGARTPIGRGWTAEMAFGRLHLTGSPATVANEQVLAGTAGSSVFGPWKLAWSLDVAPATQARDAMTAWFEPAALASGGLAVRGLRDGDRIRPLAGTGRRLVVRCFQDARVPRGARSGWPLFAAGDRIVWVPGVCRSDGLLPRPGAEALRVDVTDA